MNENKSQTAHTHTLTRADLAKFTLETITHKGWTALTFHHIAAYGGITLAQIHEFACQKERLLDVIADYIHAETSTILAQEDFTHSPQHEHLFEVLMTRFDVLMPYKMAFHKLYNDLKDNPRQVPLLIPRALQNLKTLAEQGGCSFAGTLAPLQIRGFALIYLNLFTIWLKDTTPDSSKTMAACHKAASHYVPCLYDPCKLFT